MDLQLINANCRFKKNDKKPRQATYRGGIKVINFNKANIVVSRAALGEIERKTVSLLHCEVTAKAKSLVFGHIKYSSC